MFDDIVYEYPSANRIIIIGDVHGDLKRFKKILIEAKIINNDLEWIAADPNTIVVQLGDQIDSLNRIDNLKDWEKIKDIEMINFTHHLDIIAKTKGGAVISLIGNHELMNVLGNFSYVSKLSNFETRQNFFKPSGVLSHMLSKRPIIIKIGDLCFCHAGLTKFHMDTLINNNKDVSYINNIWKRFILNGKVNLEDHDIFNKILLGQDGILWCRNLDNEETVSEILNKIGCTYMFIGHTTVNNISLLNNRIWHVDTGLSRAFGSKSYEYLEIKNHQIIINKINDTDE